MAHAGSWFGLPDFGISEAIGNILGSPRTPQGGSNIFGPSYQPAAVDSQVLGSSSSNYSSQSPAGSTPVKSSGSPSSPIPTPTPTGDNNGGGNVDPYAAYRNEISQGWDNYLGQLNSMYEGLNTQRSSQEDIANSQYKQGVNTLDLQKTQGLSNLDTEKSELQTNQAKTLRDLSGSLKNAFMAGNVYLGARGAGDSSAANQYSYALAKEGSRQRGDVMSQTADQMAEINKRAENLQNVYNTEVNNLDEVRNSKISEIANWFAGQQNYVKSQIASGQLNKSQDLASVSKSILDRALSAMDTINQEVSNRRSALESWAIAQSDNISQLRTNLANISDFTANLPGYQAINGTPTVDSSGNINVAMGYGSDNEKLKKLLGLA